VLVVENSECNRDVHGAVEEVVKKLETSLRNKGFTDTKFAVVANDMSRGSVQPALITAQGSVFFSSDLVLEALSNLQFSSAFDHLSALQFAVALPSHPGVSRSVLMLQCSSCSEQSAAYSDIIKSLISRGIELHTLTSQQLSLKGKGKSATLIGIDSDKAYTTRSFQSGQLAGDADLRRQVDLEKDICVPLALESGGSFFTMAPLMNEDKRAAAGGMLEVFSELLVSGAEQPTCEHCRCEGSGKLVCTPCQTDQTQRSGARVDRQRDFRDDREGDNTAQENDRPAVKTAPQRPRKGAAVTKRIRIS